MLDIKYIRDNKEELKRKVAEKQFDPSLVDRVFELDKKRKEVLSEVEGLRAERNKIAKEKTQDARKLGKKIKESLKKIEPELKELESGFTKAVLQIPNPAAGDVKVGKNESENEILRTWGEPVENAKFKDHLTLGEELGIIDIERAAKVSGTRFAYLKGDAALLEFALVNFAFDILTSEGFNPIVPPTLITRESMEGMGYLEHNGEDDMYVLDKDGLILAGTSEQSIGPMHKGEIIQKEDLPLRYAGFSSCFRREAGSYGKDTRGIIRVHQFDKVEMFSFTLPEKSEEEHEYLLSLEEKLFQSLKIPYRIVKMCTGDLGAPYCKKFDLEAWMPGQGNFREVTSTSSSTDFQARRLNIRYQDKGNVGYVHMLNGTAFAIGRTLVAIMENYQNEEGSITIPEVLKKYMGKDVITK